MVIPVGADRWGRDVSGGGGEKRWAARVGKEMGRSWAGVGRLGPFGLFFDKTLFNFLFLKIDSKLA